MCHPECHYQEGVHCQGNQGPTRRGPEPAGQPEVQRVEAALCRARLTVGRRAAGKRQTTSEWKASGPRTNRAGDKNPEEGLKGAQRTGNRWCGSPGPATSKESQQQEAAVERTAWAQPRLCSRLWPAWDRSLDPLVSLEQGVESRAGQWCCGKAGESGDRGEPGLPRSPAPGHLGRDLGVQEEPEPAGGGCTGRHLAGGAAWHLPFSPRENPSL